MGGRAIALKRGGIVSRLSDFWQNIKEAIAGTDKDFTTGSISKAIFLLSVPMVLEMVMESIFAVVDIFFVSKLGAGAIAVVGVTESMMTIVYAIAIGFSTATSALVARRIGEKNRGGASKAAVQAMIVTLAASILIAIPGIFWSRELLLLMGIEPVVVAETYQYTSIIISTNLVIMFLFVINAIFRSSGDAAISMRVLWLANLLNIILDPCLIFGWGPFPEMGIKGAAIATSIGRGTAVVYQIYILFKNSKRVSITRKQLVIDLGIIKKLLKLSSGGIGQYLIATSSWIVMVRILAEFGSEVLAGYTIAIRIILFGLLPSWGISNAAGTLVGQNLGANEPLRAERSVWYTGFLNMSFLGIAGFFLYLKPEFFIGLFIQDPEVIAFGASCLKILSVGFLFYGFGMVMVQALNGAGDTFTPTLINFICFWIIEIPLAWLLTKTAGWDEIGVYGAIVFSESLIALIAMIFFMRGKWKLNKV